MKGSVSAALILMLFLLSLLLLSSSSVDAREIPVIRNSSHTQVPSVVNSNKTGASNFSVESKDEYIKLESPRCDPSTDEYSTADGIPSCSELDRLVSPEGRTLRTFDQVHVTRPAIVPQCNASNHIYDPAADACGELYGRAHCGENMLLYWSSQGLDGRLFGACTCMTSSDWEAPSRPSILVGDKCYKVSTQGPCPAGQVLIPVDMYTAKCGPDACLQLRPKNEFNYSYSDDSFEFTYRNECLRTTARGFCEVARVVRFQFPYKSPSCVSLGPQEFVSAAVKLGCGPGVVEDPVTHNCRAPSAIVVDFE